MKYLSYHIVQYTKLKLCVCALQWCKYCRYSVNLYVDNLHKFDKKCKYFRSVSMKVLILSLL